MVDISLAFKEIVDDFVISAETEEQFKLFPMIGVAAWNLSNHTENQREELIKVFIDRFNCPTFIWNSTVIQTKEKIVELCSRKLRIYPELKQRISRKILNSAIPGSSRRFITRFSSPILPIWKPRKMSILWS